MNNFHKPFLRVFCTFIVMIAASLLSADDLLLLKGKPQQGGFLIGEIADSIDQVFWNYKEIILKDSIFVLAFDRDEKLRHNLTLVKKDGDMHNITIQLYPRDYSIQRINSLKRKYVNQPGNPKLSKRINNESDKIKEAREIIGNNSFHYFDRFLRPIKGGRITGTYGNQRVLNGIAKRPHNGLDIAVPKGTPIYAMTDGIVALTGDFFYNGKFVLLDHGWGLSSIYIHMSKIDVAKGDFVNCSDKIGEVGSTGRSTGNHLHWGVNWYKKRIDPEAFLKLDQVFLRFSEETATN